MLLLGTAIMFCFKWLPRYVQTNTMPAPKNNTFAIGNSGKPKKWETPEELQQDIDDYYDKCDNNKVQIVHKETGALIDVPKPIPYTVEGLCEVLGCCRETLLNYEKQEGYEEFFSTIKRAKNKIARNKIERGLMGDSAASVTIFDLKNNHGYRDRTESDINLTDTSIEELRKRKLEKLKSK